jgi:hypothetical protein
MGGPSDDTLGSDPEHQNQPNRWLGLSILQAGDPFTIVRLQVPLNAEMFSWNAINLKSRTKRVPTSEVWPTSAAFPHRHQLCFRHGEGVVL